MGDGPVRRGHTGECCGGAPAGSRDAWSSCHSAPQRRVAPCRCVQKGATTRSCRNAPMHGIAPARHARPWIPYGPSERSGRAPQSGQGSAHGALLFLASSHPPCAGIRSILLMPAGTVPAAAVTLLVCVPAPELPHAGIASQMRPARSRPPQSLTDLASTRTGA